MATSDLVKKAGVTGSYGGISFMTSSPISAIDAAHFVYDQVSKFSASEELTRRDPAASLSRRAGPEAKHWTMYAPMLALPNPDPALGLPGGTVLQPTLFIRNTTAKNINADLSLTWRGDSATGEAKLPHLHLAPFATQQMQIGTTQPLLRIPDDAHWGLVTLTTDALPDDLVAIATSTDSSGRYNLPTRFAGGIGGHFTGGEWRIDANYNQIAAVTNIGSKPTKAFLTLHYDNGRKSYELQQTIAPGDQMWVNLAQLTRQRVPDRKGNTLPMDLNSVTYDVQDLAPGGHGLMVNAVALDSSFGFQAVPPILRCCGYDSPDWSPDAFDLVLDGTEFGSIQGADTCTGLSTNLSSDFKNWWSGNSAVAAVTTEQVQGVGVGATNGYASGYVEIGNSGYCTLEPVQVSAPITVHPTISGTNIVWWFNGKNPDASTYPISVTLTSSAGSSTSWSVNQADAKVNLSSTSGAQISITSTGTHFSKQIGDITITATANGAASAPFTMTAKTPWKLSFASKQTFCNSSPQTYSTELTYNLIDNLSATMSADIAWNESVGSTVCENGSNWCKNSINTSGGSTNPVTDVLEPPNLNSSPAPTPTPFCSGQGTGTTRYRSILQTIYVGNSSSGGVQVQSDTLGYYVDHGQHDSIQSPSQPPQ